MVPKEFLTRAFGGRSETEPAGYRHATLEDVDHEEAAASSLDCINGEQILEQLLAWKRELRVRTAISGLAFATSVLGIWGDGRH